MPTIDDIADPAAWAVVSAIDAGDRDGFFVTGTGVSGGSVSRIEADQA